MPTKCSCSTAPATVAEGSGQNIFVVKNGRDPSRPPPTPASSRASPATPSSSWPARPATRSGDAAQPLRRLHRGRGVLHRHRERGHRDPAGGRPGHRQRQAWAGDAGPPRPFPGARAELSTPSGVTPTLAARSLASDATPARHRVKAPGSAADRSARSARTPTLSYHGGPDASWRPRGRARGHRLVHAGAMPVPRCGTGWAIAGDSGPRRPDDLGARLAAAARAVDAERPWIALCGECPAITADVLRQAGRDRRSAANRDRPYRRRRLLPRRRAHAAAGYLHGMPWGSERVLAETRARLARVGAAWHELPLLTRRRDTAATRAPKDS